MKNKKSIKEELDLLTKALNDFPKGASAEEIKKASSYPFEDRTFQRRLAKLVELRKVETTGNTNAKRYLLVKAEAEEKIEPEKIPGSLHLSPESVKILKSITQPQGTRKPVAYNHEFLQFYQPNNTFYLTTAERIHLAESGRTNRLNQPAGTYAKEILNRLLIDLSFNSSRLEGNTYSLLDTERLISQGEAADNKSATDAQMILNHKDAIEFIVQAGEEIGFNRHTITNLHALLSNNLLPDPAASGRLRSFAVGIHKSVYVPPAIPQQIEGIFEEILGKAVLIEDPFEQAFFIMVHLPYLQPFDDVNKRVSRLAANIPLNRHNLAPLSFIDVPADTYISGLLAVYELNRTELLKDVFLWAYERSAARYAVLRQTLGEPDPFRLKYRDNIRSAITRVVSENLSKQKASSIIHAESVRVDEPDRTKFIESVETELMSLHEGNFARYRIRPSEYWVWKKTWENSDK